MISMARRNKFFRKRWILLAVILLLCGAVYYFWISLVGGIIPITSTWRYRQILAWMPGSNDPKVNAALRIFPESIPTDAKNVRMYFHTPAGDLELELRCTLQANQVADLKKRYAPIALAEARGQDQTYGWNPARIPLPAPPLYVGDLDWQQKLPESYTMYVTNVASSKLDSNAEWIYQSGVAINPTNDDVIYWIEASASGIQPSK